MQPRRRHKLAVLLEERLAAEALRLRERAKSLPPGIQRERAVRSARQLESAMQIDEWPWSPGLRVPT